MSTPGGYITTREHYERVKKARGEVIPMASEEEIISGLVDLLITRLYDPVTDGYWRVSNRIEEIGCHLDAINWGDLGCCDVERQGDRYIVTVEEAAPEASHLRAYLERWLNQWDWNVEVRTEW